ncbi:ras-related protein RabC [Biomphalaria pfeifferi]|uniref:Ras-related protein RabC n=1 Tax=Biomphalaria pfeifferi TaxID=112525 RepID=A0AAD8FK12_BIOPF|nr:ras-related protein RabC [Biomphalaria pfeifferi]
MLQEYLLKIVIIGHEGVGKTSLLLRYTDEQFQEHYSTTIGVDFKIKNVTRDDYLAILQLWDTAGQDRFRAIVSSFYRGANGLIIVFDVCDLTSFERVPYWIDEASRYGDPSCIKLLVGNKTDKVNDRQVTSALAQSLADQFGMQYIETSAKEAQNVQAVFDVMADTIVRSKRQLNYVMAPDVMTQSFRLDSKDVTPVYSCYTGSGYCY